MGAADLPPVYSVRTLWNVGDVTLSAVCFVFTKVQAGKLYLEIEEY